MSYKIAIASTDGKVVNQHFGRAEKFYIVEVNEGNDFYYLEERNTGAACHGGEHSEGALSYVVDSLSDCKYVLVSQIGRGAEQALSERGVTAFAISLYIEEAVRKLIYYNSEINLSTTGRGAGCEITGTVEAPIDPNTQIKR